MTPLVVVAVLVAAVTHATWNALAHHIKDQLVAFTLVGAGGAVCGLALACAAPLPAGAAWTPLLVSAVLHVVYQLLLMRSFGLGDFGQMYPIARGTAPLVVTVFAAVFVHEQPGAWQLAGVAVASAGLVGVALWGVRRRAAPPESHRAPEAGPDASASPLDLAPADAAAPAAAESDAAHTAAPADGTTPAGAAAEENPAGTRISAPERTAPAPAPPEPAAAPASAARPRSGPSWAALTAAVATGLAIASYTTVDGVGVRASGSPLGYIGWLMILEGVAIPAYALLVRRGRLAGQLRPVAGRGLLGGALSVAAYGLVLWAQTQADLAPVAALRESSIIAGAAIGALFFKERFGAPRIAASVLMVGGIALMLHGG